MSDQLRDARLSYIIAESVKALPEEDRAHRIAWCKETGQHGTRMHEEGDSYRIVWGGRTLALVPKAAFADDSFMEGLSADIVPNVPDDPSGLSDH
jgi:hypothetical protein